LSTMLTIAVYSFSTEALKLSRLSSNPRSLRLDIPYLHCSKQTWLPSEDWALIDTIPSYTVGQGNFAATFWQVLVLSSPALSARSAVECETRMQELSAEVGQGVAPSRAMPPFGPQPAVLEDWAKLPDGRYTGRLAGQSSYIWLSAALEGRLAGDPRIDGEPSFIESVTGTVYELSRTKGAAVSSTLATNLPSAERASQEEQFQFSFSQPSAVLAVCAMLSGCLGFGMGTQLATPLPPPPPPAAITKVIIAPGANGPLAVTKAVKTEQSAQQQRQPTQMTIGEQRARQELRVERDKAKLRMLELKLREDEEGLAEFKRVEAEQGSNALAVKMSVFPPTAGP